METKKKQSNAKSAGILCGNPDFWLWLGVGSSEDAADCLRARCGIASRKELDSSDVAATKFYDMRKEFAYRDDD